MWSLLWYLLLGWFVSSVILHYGERRGIHTTNPSAELPGFMSWWKIFTWPLKAIARRVMAVIGWVYELAWRLVKG